MMKARELDSRVVVITGAAGGLGRALCTAFAARGARIAALDVDEQALEQLHSELALPELLAVRCDLTDEDQCGAALAEVVRRLGGVDVLVNNAGISHRSLFAQTEPAVIRRVMAVNFFGAVNATHAALPALLERRGTVVAISSVAGFAPLAARSGYAASKHALHGCFETLRAEYAERGLDVLLVCPGFIATAIAAAHLGGDGGSAQGPRTLVGEALAPELVARRVVAAVERRRRLLLVGRVAWLAWLVSRLAPRWYERSMVKRLRAEMNKRP
jgi:NAD(P)-dependent dehydrogenase (short-subunit alcohol dehydrogenase family)